MIYFKNTNGAVFAYETQDEAVQFGLDVLVQMSEQEVYDHLQPSTEQLEAEERAWRDEELKRADIELNKVQDGVGVGVVGDWREYRCLLRDWPEHASFPDSEFRPVAPDAV